MSGDAEGAGRQDTLLGGRIRLAQPASGHRAGTDAVLLAAAGPTSFTGSVVDLGSGVGTVGIAFAARSPMARVRLVEIDPALSALAAANVVANGLDARVTATTLDVTAPLAERRAAGIADAQADLVLTNPPFDRAAAGRGSPDPARRRAHVMPEGGFAAWFRAAAEALVHRGTLVAIARADALPDLLDALSGRFGGVVILPVHPRAGEPAKRILLRAVKGGRGPFSLLPGFVLHGADGRFTASTEALHRGEADLAAVCPAW